MVVRKCSYYECVKLKKCAKDSVTRRVIVVYTCEADTLVFYVFVSKSVMSL